MRRAVVIDGNFAVYEDGTNKLTSIARLYNCEVTDLLKEETA